MGDRNNPIKFGPEWLRNLARERNAGRGSSTPQSGTRPGPGAGSRTPGSQGPVRARSGSPLGGSGASGAGTGSAGSGPVGACGPVVSAFPVAGASGTSSRHASNSQYPKVQLANLRYGREEMLALFDRNAEPPEELKYFDLLYHPRGKPPVALNTYEEDTREARAGAGPERYGAGRGRGMPPEVRGRSRMPFVRHSSAVSAGRMPGYSGGLDEESSSRSWSSSNNMGSPRTDQGDWTTSKMFRSNRRQANNTNWRQACRDEGDEWRYQETSRPPNRSTADKWDRDWSERPSQERPQSWAPSRRQWAGDTTNEDNLPEWAIDSAEAGAGSFDSSGAFHGYSNDDSNLPRTQETTYPLTRSHTHGGSISRSKTVEEGSEEWWSSEKAKKLSPKRFEAGDSRFKKASSAGTEEVSGGGNSTKQIASTEKSHQLDSLQGSSESISDPSNNAVSDDKQHDLRQKISDNKTFEAFMRSDIEFPETAENKGNFQSVMINSNRGLRQQHQNIVTPINETSMSRQQQMNANGLLQILHGRQMSENDGNEASQANEDSIVDEFIDMTLEDNPNRPNVPLQPGAITPGMMNQRHLMRIPGSAVAHQGQAQGMPNVSMANVGNQSMNNLGMNMAPGSGHGLPMQGLLPPAMNPMNPAMGPTIGPVLQHRVIGAFQQNAGLPVMPTPNVANNSLFMGQNAQQMPTSDMQSHTAPPNLFPMHGMQHGNPGFSSIYSNILPPNNIGGNMSSNMGNMSSNMGNMSNMGHMGNMSNMGNMGNMGHMGNMGTNLTANVGANMAGNIGSNIGANIGAHMAGNIAGNMGGDIVGNLSGTIGGAIGGNLGCNSGNNLTATMSGNMGGNIPGNIGSNISDQWFYEDPKKTVQGPFSSKEMYGWYRAGFFNPSLMVRRACESHMRPLGSYGPVVPFAQVDVLPSYPISGFEPRPQNHDLLNQQPPLTMEESLWGQPSNNQDLSMWMQQMPRADQSSKMTIFFWDQPSSAISSNALLPEELAKEMKTEDQILAQLRAAQSVAAPATSFLNDLPSSSSTARSDESYSTNVSSTPDLKQLQKLMVAPQSRDVKAPSLEREVKPEKPGKKDQNAAEASTSKTQPAKAAKQNKNDNEKLKNKETSGKGKKQKAKEEKKEDENKNKEDDKDKTPHEISPTKSKKEDKMNKKELEKEKKEWVKEGFTIVKGSEKDGKKENKKKNEEAKIAEEAERKKKDDEKAAVEEEKKKKPVELKKLQDNQQRILEPKRAPWSASQVSHLPHGLPLGEIQRLEKEKKLEQMREQQHMVHLLAQEQAAGVARDQAVQEMQANHAPWNKKKIERPHPGIGQSFADIQAETRRQATASALPMLSSFDEPIASTSQAPWTNSQNGDSINTGGFWDTQPSTSRAAAERAQDPRPETSKKKKGTVAAAPSPKKENTACDEFDRWSQAALDSWSTKIDVPTFVGFLKDIESPYEVKDYVKCYLGESKESNDFARQFLEKRSKLLRVGMVTPSDDLCSPAMAVNPRGALDFQEGKGKKSKKKMLKVDARILGFSVTASEDRINVGDIDTV